LEREFFKDWRVNVKNLIEDKKTLKYFLKIFNLEEYSKKINWEAFDKVSRFYPFRITPYYLSVVIKSDSLFKVFFPSLKEISEKNKYYGDDPLSEEVFKVDKRGGIIHKYRDRVLVILTDFCSNNCRYCNRKRLWRSHLELRIDEIKKELNEYLTKNNEIKEVILSGGEPLIYENSILDDIIGFFYNKFQIDVIRIHTKLISSLPQRFFDEEFIKILEKYRDKLWFYSHIIHSDEITPYVEQATKIINSLGIYILNQAPIIREVNDKKEVLKELIRKLLKNKIIPKNFYQLDPIDSTLHFMTDIDKTVELISNVYRETTGLGWANYIIDLPKGKGKVPLPLSQIEKNKSLYRIKNFYGEVVDYNIFLDIYE